MKKLIAVILAVIVTAASTFVLCSCKGGGKTKSDNDKQSGKVSSEASATVSDDGSAGSSAGQSTPQSVEEPDDDEPMPETPVLSEGLEYAINEFMHNAYTVTGIGTFSGQHLVIPDTYEDLPVTGIAKKAFMGKNVLRSVIIPDSVTDIDDQAFYVCKKLKTVIIGKGLKTLGYGTFLECESLESVSVDEENPDFYSAGNCIIKRDTGKLYVACNTSVIPDDGSVTSIDADAFVGLKNLTSIHIPASVTDIAVNTFAYCPRLESITVADGNEVFYSEGNCLIKRDVLLLSGCLASVIPDEVTAIADNAFVGCTGLTSVHIPDGVTNVGEMAFSGCTSLKTVTFGENCRLTAVKSYTFYYCLALENVVLPEGVTTIGQGAFCGCAGLKSITIPAGVTSIGDIAFNSCKALTTINFGGTVAKWDAMQKGDGWKFNVPATCVVNCVNGTATI